MSRTQASVPDDALPTSRHPSSAPSISALVAVAVLPTLALAPRWLRGTRHFAWDVGDTAGTMSYVRSLCLEPTAETTNPLLNYPLGFDISAYPFWNLLDEVRLQATSLFDCSTNSLAIIFALTPLIAMIGNCLAGFIFGYSVTKNNLDGLVIALFGVFSPDILLQTRTSLSNNVLLFGLLSLASMATYCRTLRAHWLVIYASLLTLQIWTNVYVGAGTTFTSFIVIICLLPSSTFLRKLHLLTQIFAATVLSILLGLAPLLRSQWFLMSGSALAPFVRPIETERSEFRELLTSPGLLTVGSILSVILLVISFARRRSFFRGVVPFCGVVVILILNSDGQIFGPLQALYSRVLGPLRGVAYFMTFVPILFAFMTVQLRSEHPNFFRRPYASAKRFLIPIFLLDALTSLPRAGFQIEPTFYRSVALEEVAAPYSENLHLEGALLQLPDYYYSGTEIFYGAPGREILIDQMIHGMALINGRDFLTALRNCEDIYSPDSLINLDILAARGGGTIALRLEDLPVTQTERIRAQLSSAGWIRLDPSPTVSPVKLELWKASYVPAVNLSSACSGNW